MHSRLSIWVVMVMAGPCLAQSFSAGPAVQDGFGTVSTGGALRLVAAAGQPGGVGPGGGPGTTHLAGFLYAAPVRHGPDTDGDGVPDELDPDNDGDGLPDDVELTGIAFDPTTPTDHNAFDSDGDDISDAEEALAGTDPGNPDAFLAMHSIDIESDGPILRWIARANRRYEVQRNTTGAGHGLYPSIATHIAGPGAGPWQVTTGLYHDAGAPTNIAVYRIRVAP
jgi:hypothetical protein